ncbi:MAG: hypothetical protein OXC00_05985, partial [Acidimicrobiaceae bacterium]|nr:hypothetical protein [Acidimicrobiaceae bacterium]
MPVLVLLAVFVLWAGRGGRAGLTADLAAEEAATAAAVCCDEDTAGEDARELVAEEMLRSRPGLDFLCIGGPRPNAGGGSDEFVDESWVEFEAGRDSGGVGVLGVRFVCETDGAVAPLRGLFPTVTFAGQASEIVLRQPRPIETAAPNSIWIEPERQRVDEGEELVFTVHTDEGVPRDTRVRWRVYTGDEATAADRVDDFEPDVPVSDTVTIPAGEKSAEIIPRFMTFPDRLYEGDDDETLVLDLELGSVIEHDGVNFVASSRLVDPVRSRAVGMITDIDPRPHLWVDPAAARVPEGKPVTFEVRLRDASGVRPAPSAETVTVDVVTRGYGEEAGATAYGRANCDDDGVSGVADDADYVSRTAPRLVFDPGEVVKTVTVQACDDEDAPQGETDEWFALVLDTAAGAQVARGKAVVTITDDEVTVSGMAPLRAYENDGTVRVAVSLDRAPTADVMLGYYVENNNDPGFSGVSAVGGADCAVPGVDYLTSSGTLTFMGGNAFPQSFGLELCPDTDVERDETLWIRLVHVSGEVHVGDGSLPLPGGGGGRFTIRNDDGLVISADDVSGFEAPVGGSLAFEVNLTDNGVPVSVAGPVSVAYALVEDSPVSAQQCTDYTPAGVSESDCGDADPAVSGLAGTLVFGPGTAAAETIEVALLEDHVSEDDETFRLVLSDGDPADIATLEEVFAVGTIIDDAPPVVSVGDFE